MDTSDQTPRDVPKDSPFPPRLELSPEAQARVDALRERLTAVIDANKDCSLNELYLAAFSIIASMSVLNGIPRGIATFRLLEAFDDSEQVIAKRFALGLLGRMKGALATDQEPPEKNHD